jgi:hypothetical protein
MSWKDCYKSLKDITSFIEGEAAISDDPIWK